MNQKMLCFKRQKFKGKKTDDSKSFCSRVWGKILHQNKQTNKNARRIKWYQTSYLENFMQEDNGAVFSKNRGTLF